MNYEIPGNKTKLLLIIYGIWIFPVDTVIHLILDSLWNVYT